MFGDILLFHGVFSLHNLHPCAGFHASGKYICRSLKTCSLAGYNQSAVNNPAGDWSVLPKAELF